MEFPYTAWVLMPSFKPVEVTFVSSLKRWSQHEPEYHEAKNEKIYHVRDIYKSKTEAIRAGHQRLNEQQEALDKRQLSLNKRRAALEKAAK